MAIYYLWEIYFLQHPEISLDTYGPYRIFCVLRDIGSVILFIWTYHPEPVKAFLSIFLMEIVLTVITIPPLFLVNVMEHREEVFGIPGLFMPTDLLIPVFTFLFWKLVRHPLLFLMEKYRSWKLKKQWVLTGIWLIIGFSVIFLSMQESESAEGFGRFLMIHQVWALVLAAAAILIIWRRKKEIKGTNLYLYEQLQIARNHYMALTVNRKIMENTKALADEQIGQPPPISNWNNMLHRFSRSWII